MIDDRWKRIRNNYIWGAFVVVIIDAIWMLLEKILYGEVQPRLVDDIVSIGWIIAIMAAYNRGYSHGAEERDNGAAA